MTFTELRDEIAARLNFDSTEADSRIERAINRVYKSVTSTIGLETSRRVNVTADATIGEQELTFTGVEKLISVWETSSGTNRVLDQITHAELLERSQPTGDAPSVYAITRMGAGSVTITLDQIPETAYTLNATGHDRADTLSGAQEPAFPESFHDILIEGVLADEYRKMEKPTLAKMSMDTYQQRLSELRMFIAKSNILRIRQNDRPTVFGRIAGAVASAGAALAASAISFLQAGAGALARTVQNKLRDTVSPADFTGNDFGEKLAAAIAALPSTGGVVDARGIRGTQTTAANPFEAILDANKPILVLLDDIHLETDVTIVVPQKCVIRGTNRGDSTVGTTIKASDDFVSDFVNGDAAARAAVIVLGDQTTYSFECRLEQLAVDGNNIADIAVYSESVQEWGGLDFVATYRTLTRGVWFEKTTNGNPQNYHLNEVEVNFDPDEVDAAAIGVDLLGAPSDTRGLNGLTVNGAGPDGDETSIATGLRLNRTPGVYSRIHVEGCVDGVTIGDLNGTSGVVLAGVTGHSTVTNLIKIPDTSGTQDIACIGIVQQSATNTIVDARNSEAITASSVCFYSIGQGNSGVQALLTTARVLRQQLRTRSLELSGETANTTGISFGAGEVMQWRAQRSANNTDFQIRDLVNSFSRFIIETGAGRTTINSGTGGAAVRVNDSTDAGTGGLEIYSGGATPARVARISAAGAVLPEADGTQALGSATKRWQVFHDVVATASLPAADAANDGRILIEDGGTGNRNLAFYAGGERFFVDGSLGQWTTPAFADTDFTGNGSMTWTVASGDVGTYEYTLIGKTMTVVFVINTSTVGGTPNTTLQIAIPAGKTAAKAAYNPVLVVDNSSRTTGYATVAAGGTLIQIIRTDAASWSASTDATSIFGQITFEVQ